MTHFAQSTSLRQQASQTVQFDCDGSKGAFAGCGKLNEDRSAQMSGPAGNGYITIRSSDAAFNSIAKEQTSSACHRYRCKYRKRRCWPKRWRVGGDSDAALHVA